MLNWRHFSVTKKLALTMATIVMLIAAFLCLVGYALWSTGQRFEALVDTEIAMIAHGNVAKIKLLEARRNEKDALYNDDPLLIRETTARLDEVRAKVGEVAALADRASDAPLIALVGQLKESAEQYRTLFAAAAAAPVGQQRLLAAIPMRRAATAAETQLNEALQMVDTRIGSVRTEVQDYAFTLATLIIGLGSGGIVFAAIMSALLSRSIAGPLRQLRERMGDISEGRLDVDVPFTDLKEDVGAMARSLAVFKDRLIENRRMAAAQAEAQAARERRTQAVDGLVRAFDGQSAAVLRGVSAAATELDATAQSMSAIAEETNRQAGAAAGTAEQATANVQTVAAAAEEMAASIREITIQVARSKEIADKAAADVARTDDTAQGLAASAQQIGAVVELIQSIAAQTNLLALNATIEAARAGEAGKGFAVVASEVKDLAGQTAKATEAIAAQVGSIQNVSEGVLQAIRSIGDVIREVNDVAASVAAAMEQQGASTQEISRNVTAAAQGTQEVSDIVRQVTDAAGQTGSAATQVLGASRELSQQSEALRQQVERFLADIRAA